MIQVGLRIDVDTLRGTSIGVPNLVRVLGEHNIQASFFFSVGPDNMGRHLWRILRPRFAAKMLRTRAASLYGWDILLRGTFWPGPKIGKRCARQIRETDGAGHEIGLHAYDHHLWQSRIKRMDRQSVFSQVQKGYRMLATILDRPPDAFAAPGWRMTPQALLALEQFAFGYQSDCRGHAMFRPLVGGELLSHVQVPVTLPTYDELVGRECSADTYNAHLLRLIRPQGLNVLTIHAEAEGIGCLDLFQDFLIRAKEQHIAFSTLGDLVSAGGAMMASEMTRAAVPGREGWIASQGEAASVSACDWTRRARASGRTCCVAP